MASDLTSDWKDGSKFYLLLHLYSPDSLPTENLSKMSDIERLTQAFNTAEKQYGKILAFHGRGCSPVYPSIFTGHVTRLVCDSVGTEANANFQIIFGERFWKFRFVVGKFQQ